MGAQILETLGNQPVLLLFLVIGLGYLIGGLHFGGFSFGPVAGVLFAGLFFGHFGLRLSPDAQALGFALFIFSVGYQAGPRFFDVLMTDGLRYLALAAVPPRSQEHREVRGRVVHRAVSPPYFFHPSFLMIKSNTGVPR